VSTKFDQDWITLRLHGCIADSNAILIITHIQLLVKKKWRRVASKSLDKNKSERLFAQSIVCIKFVIELKLLKCIYFFSQDGIVEMICLWESKFPASENYFQLHQLMDLILFHDGAQIFKRSVHVEGFQDVWPFDRLPYVDLAHNSSPPPEENQRKEG
jgi:hypothetical protein